jgi:hypothetical protein
MEFAAIVAETPMQLSGVVYQRVNEDARERRHRLLQRRPQLQFAAGADEEVPAPGNVTYLPSRERLPMLIDIKIIARSPFVGPLRLVCDLKDPAALGILCSVDKASFAQELAALTYELV